MKLVFGTGLALRMVRDKRGWSEVRERTPSLAVALNDGNESNEDGMLMGSTFTCASQGKFADRVFMTFVISSPCSHCTCRRACLRGFGLSGFWRLTCTNEVKCRMHEGWMLFAPMDGHFGEFMDALSPGASRFQVQVGRGGRERCWHQLWKFVMHFNEHS